MVGGRALCDVCRQPKWIYDLNEYGQKIQIGRWDDGGPKFKVHGHQCQGPNYMSAAPQKVDRLHDRTNEAIQYVNQKADESAEFVKDRAQSNHVNVWAMAADVALIKTDVETCKQHLETLVKKSGLFQGADNMLNVKKNKNEHDMLPPRRPDLDETAYDDENENSQVSEAVEEIAETDDTTHGTDNNSINFLAAPEVVEQQHQ